MNRLGFIVLSILSQNGATNKLSSMSVQEISDTEEFGYKPNTIFKKIKEFEDAGYIGRGLEEGGRTRSSSRTPDGNSWKGRSRNEVTPEQKRQPDEKRPIIPRRENQNRKIKLLL